MTTPETTTPEGTIDAWTMLQRMGRETTEMCEVLMALYEKGREYQRRREEAEWVMRYG